ncbi:hypothetical protein N658DRAFT_500762 [Parathielavia hyrcaniae]|uniref:Uncharacterized protein n=1 Tax=Parathielavia hyrcaniae TaxID=113614 RepID=A0AAN6PSI8_9PEZI|nr:hypothetical protein N658DRAFT_500762 [Parathielavia hyrcaniae]
MPAPRLCVYPALLGLSSPHCRHVRQPQDVSHAAQSSLQLRLMAVIMSFSSKALVVAVLVATGVLGNPIAPRNDTATYEPIPISPCATVKCTAETTCVVIDGKAQCLPIKGTPCGPTVCEAGLECCNASCGTCVKPGMACTQQACDYPPFPTPCGPTVCERGLECCNASCGICVKPGGFCTQQYCEPPKLEPCGHTFCKPGTECCNPSCGICVEPGKGCTKQLCPPPKEEICGRNVCPTGQVCCNASCGICTPPGGFCTQQFCGYTE